jgi:hypothetical protein
VHKRISAKNIYKYNIYKSNNMNLYKCEKCNYQTNRKIDLQRHKTSRKHLKNIQKCNDITNNKNVIPIKNITKNTENTTENIKKEYISCNLCKKKFTTKTSMYRHRKHYCENLNEINDDKDIKIEKLEKQIEEVLKLANKNADVVTKNAETINIATKTNKQTINMMSYAVDNLQNAPPIKQLRSDKIVKMLNENNKSKNFSVEAVILHQFKNNILHHYLGEVILQYYKKDDPDDQSLWSTDVARSNFIIKCAVKGDDNESEWINDKSGTKIKKYIIVPMMEKVKQMITVYLDALGDKMRDVNTDVTNMREYADEMLKCHEMISVILKKKINLKILKYISPKFDFNVDKKIFKKDINIFKKNKKTVKSKNKNKNKSKSYSESDSCSGSDSESDSCSGSDSESDSCSGSDSESDSCSGSDFCSDNDNDYDSD